MGREEREMYLRRPPSSRSPVAPVLRLIRLSSRPAFVPNSGKCVPTGRPPLWKNPPLEKPLSNRSSAEVGGPPFHTSTEDSRFVELEAGLLGLPTPGLSCTRRDPPGVGSWSTADVLSRGWTETKAEIRLLPLASPPSASAGSLEFDSHPLARVSAGWLPEVLLTGPPQHTD